VAGADGQRESPPQTLQSPSTQYSHSSLSQHSWSQQQNLFGSSLQVTHSPSQQVLPFGQHLQPGPEQRCFSGPPPNQCNGLIHKSYSSCTVRGRSHKGDRNSPTQHRSTHQPNCQRAGVLTSSYCRGVRKTTDSLGLDLIFLRFL
jgi:hypothetical protein